MRRFLPALLLSALAACAQRPAGPGSADGARGRAAAPEDAASADAGGQLARVRSPGAPCLPGAADASADALSAAAARRRAEGQAEGALACADAALELAPRALPPLRERAQALADLGRDADARAALSRALAADPDDVATLLVAAEIHVLRFGDRDSLEAGRDLALRGAAHALAGPAAGRARAPRLFLVAAMAENDLGRNREALDHLDRVLAADPRDPDALYERGVALYELCRFAPARRAFEAVLRRVPDDAWSIHHLGLIAERAGDERRSRDLLSRAARLAPREIRAPVELPPAAFEAELRRAVAELPAEERAALDGVPVGVEEVPSLPDLVAVDPPLSPSILGLFRGPSLGEPCDPAEPGPCRSIVLYRRNLQRFAHDRSQLAEQVRVTLLHELGHLHGESDEELRARGLE